jgi:hypothetical protein
VQVTLEGVLTSARGDSTDWTGILHGRASGRHRVLVDIDEATAARVGGHAEYRGRVLLTAEGLSARRDGVRLDLLPRGWRGLAAGLTRRLEEHDLLSWLGVEVEPAPVGLRVRRIVEDRTGLRPGDQIVELLGTKGRLIATSEGFRCEPTGACRPITGKDSLVAAWAAAGPRIAVGVVRRGVPEIVELEKRGYPAVAPSGLVRLGILLVAALPLGLLGLLILLWERRRAGRALPRPRLVVAGSAAALAVLPAAPGLIAADLDVGVLYLVVLTALVAVGLLDDGLPAAARIVAVQLPAALALLPVVALSGTLSTQGIVLDQGGAPWNWHLFDDPFVLASGLIYLASALDESTSPVLVSGLAATVFLGGWRIPGVSPGAVETSAALSLAAAVVFLTKVVTLVVLIAEARRRLAASGTDLVALSWNVLLPAALASFVLAAAWLALFPDPSWPRLAMRSVVCAAGALGLAGAVALSMRRA